MPIRPKNPPMGGINPLTNSISAPVSSVKRKFKLVKVADDFCQGPHDVRGFITSNISVVAFIASHTIKVLANQERAQIEGQFHGRRETIRPGGRVTTSKERRATRAITIPEGFCLSNIKMTAAKRFSITRESAKGLHPEMLEVVSDFNDFLQQLEDGEISETTKKAQMIRAKNEAIKAIEALKKLGVK